MLFYVWYVNCVMNAKLSATVMLTIPLLFLQVVWLLSYMVLDGLLPQALGRDILATSMFMIMTGLTLIVMRSRAIMQMIGLITMENGIYLLGLIMTEGLPLIIELGIFLDVLIAVVILVILTSRLRLSFKTTDTNVLDKLKG